MDISDIVVFTLTHGYCTTMQSVVTGRATNNSGEEDYVRRKTNKSRRYNIHNN